MNGALAEELGKGLQNPVHECESRTRLQLWVPRKIYCVGFRASGGTGIRCGLKIRCQIWLEGSSPSSPTTRNLSHQLTNC